MTIRKSILYPLMLITLTFLLMPPVFGATEQKEVLGWKLKGRSETVAEWKEADNATSSTDGDITFRQELSLSLTREMGEDLMGFNFRGRATDNTQISEDKAALLYFNGFYKWDNWRVELGDVAASMNPLVLSASAKGLKVRHKTGTYDKGYESVFMSGIQKSAWDQVYQTDRENSNDRYLAGFQTEGRFGAGKKAAVSLSTVYDDPNSDFSDTGTGTTSPARATTAGVSWNWRFNRYFTARGDVGHTWSDENTDDGQGRENAFGVKLKFLTKPHKKYLRSNFVFERMDPDYKPFVASASADSLKIQNDSTIMFNRQFKARVTLKRSRNNLEDDLDNQRTTDDGVLYLTYRPDWMKRGEFDFRTQMKQTEVEGSSPQDQGLSIAELNVSLRPKSGWRYGLGWIYTDIDEDTGSFEDQQIHTLRSNLAWKKRLAGDSMFRTAFRLDYNMTEKDSGDNKSFGGKVDLGYDTGKLWSLDFTASTKKSYRDASDDNQYTAYELRGNYHPGGDRSRTLRLNAARRTTDSDGSDTVDEHVLKLSYLFAF